MYDWRMRKPHWWTIAPGLAGVAGAVGLLLWPLNSEGVAGNAITPHYRDFGWFSYTPLPDHPSRDDLRRAGATVPNGAVAERRRDAAVAAGLGVIGLAVGIPFRRRAADGGQASSTG